MEEYRPSGSPPAAIRTLDARIVLRWWDRSAFAAWRQPLPRTGGARSRVNVAACTVLLEMHVPSRTTGVAASAVGRTIYAAQSAACTSRGGRALRSSPMERVAFAAVKTILVTARAASIRRRGRRVRWRRTTRGGGVAGKGRSASVLGLAPRSLAYPAGDSILPSRRAGEPPAAK